MAVTPAFESPFEYPDATRKRALGSRHANTGRTSCVLPGDRQQAPPALSATVGIVDSSMISRRVSVADMLHIPSLVPRLVASLAKTSLAKNQEWSRSCGTS